MVNGDKARNMFYLDEIIESTLQKLEAQSVVPMSPGVIAGDSVLLCAGAAFVKEAAADMYSGEFSEAFAREAVSRGDSDYIRSVGATIGLDEEMVQGIVMKNDALPSGERLSGTLNYLKSLGSRGLRRKAA